MDRILTFEQYLKLQKNHIKNDLESIYSNFYYTWGNSHSRIFDDLNGVNWHKSAPPSSIIDSYIETKDVNEQDKEIKCIREIINSQDKYIGSKSWFDANKVSDSKLFKLEQNPVVFFSAEFALTDWLQIYSGGLGVLAGDFLKQSSDLGIPFIGVGIFYNQGYFHQEIDISGNQKEDYIPQNPASMFLTLLKDEHQNPIEVEVIIEDHIVFVRGWLANVGRNKLILLDTNFEKNEVWEDRMITAHLYGGTTDTRIRQEVVLGIGGYQFIKKYGIVPGIIHLNEGHAGFVSIAKLLDIYDTNKTLEENIVQNSHNQIFTNHTLNPAGNDKFELDLFRKYLNKYANSIGISIEELFKFGTDSKYSPDKFTMTILGIKSSKISNAVSRLHGQKAREEFGNTNIRDITNGVHLPTWVGPHIAHLFRKYVNENWLDSNEEIDWNLIDSIPNYELINAHISQKHDLIETINQTLGVSLNSKLPTVVWTRRFASYKRPNIFINDIIRLSKLVLHPKLKFQFLIGGKAHPQDTIGKQMLADIVKISKSNEFENKVVFLTDYNWKLARKLVAGSDIWLNNPIRFEEASGTSGMKAGANGVLQLTTLDGWTDEVDWIDKGWILPQADIHSQIYDILEHQIAPAYYDSHNDQRWIYMMKNTMKEVMKNYSTRRMMLDYLKLYKELIN